MLFLEPLKELLIVRDLTRALEDSVNHQTGGRQDAKLHHFFEVRDLFDFQAQLKCLVEAAHVLLKSVAPCASDAKNLDLHRILSTIGSSAYESIHEIENVAHDDNPQCHYTDENKNQWQLENLAKDDRLRQ